MNKEICIRCGQDKTKTFGACNTKGESYEIHLWEKVLQCLPPYGFDLYKDATMKKSKLELRIARLEKALEHLAFIVAASQPCAVPFAYKHIKDMLDETLNQPKE